jgi:hypothetical protein
VVERTTFGFWEKKVHRRRLKPEVDPTVGATRKRTNRWTLLVAEPGAASARVP